MIAETTVTASDLIYPMFLVDGINREEPIKSLPGISRFSKDGILKEMEFCFERGVRAFALFPKIQDELKDRTASYSYAKENFYLETLRFLKERLPEAVLMTDVAMDPYSSDGHDGLVEDGKIVNDKTLEILAKMSVAQAQAGADIIGPSDMMDGRVSFIRSALDGAGWSEVSIMSYTAKYASHFYGPFRDALDSAPKAGDKKTYQMDYRNRSEAVREALLDQSEGADFLMVKPALCYLDIISDLKQNTQLPIAAYNVSGEYAMIKAAAEKGWISERDAVIESLTAIKRAGADIILTYWAKSF
jgi:porphobilinogen synthase